MKTVWILRGIPGCGKTTVAEKLSEQLNGVHVEADMYFSRNGEYIFDPSKLKQAHEWCFSTFKQYIDTSCENIIVSNTSTMYWEFERYKQHAEENGYMVHVLICENYHNGENEHKVPIDKIVAMKNRFSINL